MPNPRKFARKHDKLIQLIRMAGDAGYHAYPRCYEEIEQLEAAGIVRVNWQVHNVRVWMHSTVARDGTTKGNMR